MMREQKTEELAAGDGRHMLPETPADTHGGPKTETPQTNDTIINTQAKADAIGKLMNENEHLKSIVEDLQRKSIETA